MIHESEFRQFVSFSFLNVCPFLQVTIRILIMKRAYKVIITFRLAQILSDVESKQSAKDSEEEESRFWLSVYSHRLGP